MVLVRLIELSESEVEVIAIKEAFGFENKTCSRCSGSGHFSYCDRYGTKCFGCAGAGWAYTSRGQAAMDMYVASLSVRAGDLKVGDVIRFPHTSLWLAVTCVGYEDIGIGRKAFHVTCGTCGYGCNANDLIRLHHTAEQKKAKIDAALAYQASL